MSETGDGVESLDYLRIPFEKIKFGEKLEVQGYGTVFEGEFDDRKVALKQLNITNLANIKAKLLAEILTISRFRQHPNLVALLGFCDEKSNEVILVYEYVGGGNLADKMRKRLNTIQRFEICLGAARGLDYLHTGVDSTTPGIVHGNVKLSKILLNLDSNSVKYEAKVSSFGLSKIVPGKAQKALESAEVTKESDVYSFGVLLLEVLCGVSELVDTDDYQERHVTELVPKKMEQGKLGKIVHFDIRKEIKTEALETYAKIACQCVMEMPEARPAMAQVVEELENALRLQGGEVTYVQISGGRNVAGAKDETVALESESNIENESVDVNIPITEKDEKDLMAAEGAREDDGNEVSIVDKLRESSDGEKNTLEDTSMETVPNKTEIEDVQSPTGNNDTVTERDILDFADLKLKSNITVENKEENESRVLSKNVSENTTDEEISTTVLESTEETTDDLDSSKKSKITEEIKEDDQSMKITTPSESSNGDTSNLTDQEMQGTPILQSDVPDDELEPLRIPYEKIKFGERIDVHGYGTMFAGEFNDQQVALKRLNTTNLGTIKPKLISAILTIYRFRQHPNLVALIGFCEVNNKEIILVYEYISGGNLADKMSKHLTTIQRLEICLGAARGLEYLHHGVESVDLKPGIIHGDLKLSKILLNLDSASSKFEAKVSGFGLPKLLPGDVEMSPKSKDPLHAETLKLNKESDVYTFGVMLLEVLCGVPELVDTDDYQERHVTELVPKRLEQNMLRKIVHFDIREEITTESLETYAKIACRCVMKNPEERPAMSEVVEELEKALRLQGGKVSDVQIDGSSSDKSLPEVPVGEDDHKGDEDETMSLNTTEEESKLTEKTVDDITLLGQSIPVPNSVIDDTSTEKDNVDNTNDPESTEDKTVDLNSNEKSKVIEENEVDKSSLKPDNGNGLTEVPIDEDDQGYDYGEPMSSNVTERESKLTEKTVDDITLESVPNKTDIEDVQSPTGNNDTVTERDILDFADLKPKSNITVENKEENESKVLSKNVPDTTEETIDDLDSHKKSKITEENKEDDQSMKITTTSESSNGDTSNITNQEMQATAILKSDVPDDELEPLRIPYEKIKFGERIDVHGYGTMFAGEFNDQQVALKRLNITNLGTIKPKLLSAILTIYRFRQHPNLVALIGFCEVNNKEIVLVYEYISGGNLADKMSKHLTTIQRLEICLGAARGLEYLHHGVESVDLKPGIIHGDLKLSKILLNMDSASSKFEAKISGFGLPKLLPGDVEMSPKSKDPLHAETLKLTKESDVYTFGVLLLEVLCGVPELVDTDDYQERHVTELVPKRLEQNMLRKIVHFDIREEITTESLETYAKIACRCVMKNPEERPAMSEVVEELEKALRLQGGKVSDVQIDGSSSDKSLPEVPVGEDDHKGDEDETTSLNITEEESKLTEKTVDDIALPGQSIPVQNLVIDDIESAAEGAEKDDIDNTNDPESTEDNTVDLNSNESSMIIEENEVDKSSPKPDNGNGLTEVPIGEEESKVIEETTRDIVLEDAGKENDCMTNESGSIEEITVNQKPNEEPKITEENEVHNENPITTLYSKSDNGIDSNSTIQEHVLDERSDYEDPAKDQGHALMMNTHNPHMKEITEVQDSVIVDGNAKVGSMDVEKTELIVNIRGGDLSNKIQESESKRSNSTCSESSNGDGTTPSDYLLPKSPPVYVKITSKDSRNCCSCSWWRFICDRVVFYGGQFWNKLISCFTWITGRCSSKKD